MKVYGYEFNGPFGVSEALVTQVLGRGADVLNVTDAPVALESATAGRWGGRVLFSAEGSVCKVS